MQNHPPNDQFVSLVLAGLAGLAALSLLRYAGNVAAFPTGRPAPAGSPASGLGVLADPLDPGAAIGAAGLNPVVCWLIIILVLTGLGIGAFFIRQLVQRGKDNARFQNLAGTATATEIARVASRKALLSRATTLRPSVTDRKPDPREVGYLLGRAKGSEVWATIEDSMLLVGPPRSGKGLNVVINSILDAPGPVLTTSTRPDNLTATLLARERKGPVAVFDPQSWRKACLPGCGGRSCVAAPTR